MGKLKRLSAARRLEGHGQDLAQAAEINVSRHVELEFSSQGEEESRPVASDEDESLQRSVAPVEERCHRLKKIVAKIERNVEF